MKGLKYGNNPLDASVGLVNIIREYFLIKARINECVDESLRLSPHSPIIMQLIDTNDTLSRLNIILETFKESLNNIDSVPSSVPPVESSQKRKHDVEDVFDVSQANTVTPEAVNPKKRPRKSFATPFRTINANKEIRSHSIVNNSADDAEYDYFKHPIFDGLCFTSTGMSEAERNTLKSLVEENGGRYSAACNNQIDILVMEKDSIGSPKHKLALRFEKHCLTSAWVSNSIEKGYALQPENYQQKFSPKELPLANEKIVVSNYMGTSRAHIEALVTALGGEYAEMLKKCDNGILISPDSRGKKFQAAKAWNLTVVKAEWLVECYKQKRRVNEIPFLVGGTAASENNIKSIDSNIPSSNRFDSFDTPVEVNDDQSTPCSHRRYNFFKSRLLDYNSPNPRTSISGNSRKVETKTVLATKVLDFDKEEDVDHNQTLMEFKLYEERRQSRNMERPLRRKIIVSDEPPSNTERTFPFESEALVEWNYTQQLEEEVAVKCEGLLCVTNVIDPEQNI